MIRNITSIRWDLVQEAVPAFLTMIVMPLTYSVAYGFIAGARLLRPLVLLLLPLLVLLLLCDNCFSPLFLIAFRNHVLRHHQL